MDTEQQAKLDAEQKAKEEAEAKAKAETEAQDDETTKDEDKTKSDEESKQLAAELQREREAREKAEKASAELAFKLREKKRNKDEEEDEEEDEDKPLTMRDFLSLQAKDREETKKLLRDNEARKLAETLSDDETVRQLTLEKWKTHSFPEHLSLEEQIEESYVMANRKKLIGERNEALRALRGKEGSSNDSSETFHDAQPSNQPKMAGVDNATIKRLGFKWNNTNKRFEKKTKTGLIVHDPQTGKTQSVNA